MGILKNISEIFRKIVIGYVFYTFPVTLMGCLILAKYIKDNPFEFLQQPYYGAFLNTIIYVAMAQFVIWTLISCLFSITMFFSKNNRETVLKKLSGIKERDEREVQVVGKALRVSYLTTMTILLFLLFISLFYVQTSRQSADNVEPGHPPGSLTVAIQFNFLDEDAIITQREGYDDFLEINGIPVSIPGLILILLVWQVVSYRVVSWRALKVTD